MTKPVVWFMLWTLFWLFVPVNMVEVNENQRFMFYGYPFIIILGAVWLHRINKRC